LEAWTCLKRQSTQKEGVRVRVRVGVRVRLKVRLVILIAHILYLKPEYLRRGNLNAETEPATLTAYSGSILLSFRDMATATGRTTDDGPTTAVIAYLALKAGGPTIMKLSSFGRRQQVVVTERCCVCRVTSTSSVKDAVNLLNNNSRRYQQHCSMYTRTHTTMS